MEIVKKRLFRFLIILFTLSLATIAWAQNEIPERVIVNFPVVQEFDGAEALDLSVFFTLTDGRGQPVQVRSIESAQVQLIGDSTLYDALVEKPTTDFYVVLVLDASGSMGGAIEDMRAAATAAIDIAPPNAQFAVMQFNEDITVLQPFTNDFDLVKRAINSVQVENKGTCLYDASRDAIRLLNEAVQNPQERRAIILFTDGKDQLTVDDDAPCSTSTLDGLLNAATEPGRFTAINTIGMGTDASINVPELQRIALETGAFSVVGDQSNLPELFQKIMIGLNEQWVARTQIFANAGVNPATLIIKTRDSDTPFTTTFDFFSSREYVIPAPPVVVNVRSLQLDEVNDIYGLTLDIVSPEEVSSILASVWDNRQGIQITPEFRFDNPTSTQLIEIDGSEFEPGDYAIKIQAVDKEGFFIANEDDEVILAEVEFEVLEEEVVEVEQVEFQIESVNANYETNELLIILDVSNPEIIAGYEGFLVSEETRERIATIPPAEFIGEEIVIPMPEPIQLASPDGEERSYSLEMTLQTTNNQSPEAVYTDFTPRPPAPPGFFAVITQSLLNAPVIIGFILLIVLSVTGYFFFSGRSRRDSKPTPAPAVNKTMVFTADDLMDAGGGGNAGDDLFPDLAGSSPPAVSGGQAFNPSPFDSAPPPSSIPSTPPSGADATVVDFDLESVMGVDAGGRTELVDEMPKLRITVNTTPNAALNGLEQMVMESQLPFDIGREGNQLNITGDGRVSRQHIRIEMFGSDIQVVDLGSRNGSYIDGERLDPQIPRILTNSTTIVRLGSQTELKIEYI